MAESDKDFDGLEFLLVFMVADELAHLRTPSSCRRARPFAGTALGKSSLEHPPPHSRLGPTPRRTGRGARPK